MAEWNENYLIDYSPTGDDIDSFSQKVKNETARIYSLLNRLRKLDASAGLNVSDAEPFQWHVDTTNGNLYMRNAANTDWLLQGNIEQDYFGITAESIGAATVSGNMGTFYGGLSTNMPTTPEQTATLRTNDLYFAFDERKIYRWDGMAWIDFLSLQFKDLLDYERYCVPRTEVATSGAGKILQLDPETGKGNINITGSPDRLLGILIDVQNLRDDHVLCYDAGKNKIVNKPRNDINASDVAFGEAGKILRVGENGKITVDTTGSADKITGIVVETDTLQDGQVLAYDAEHNKFVPVDKDHFTDDDTAVQVTAGKLIKGNAQNKVDGSITGTAEGLHGVMLNAAGLADGNILRYHASDNSFHVEPVGAVGDAASLVLTADGETKINYNGTSPVNVDMSDLLGPDYLDVLRYYTRFKVVERNLDNIIYYLAAQNMYPDFNALTYGVFGQSESDIDEFSTKVTSAVAGDDSIDVESITGIVPGASYFITDGNVMEEVYVKACAKSGGVHRIIATSPLTETYNLSSTYIYRTTADITAGKAEAGSVQKAAIWRAGTTWSGINSDVQQTYSMNTTISHVSDFAIDGDITFSTDGKITLAE